MGENDTDANVNDAGGDNPATDTNATEGGEANTENNASDGNAQQEGDAGGEGGDSAAQDPTNTAKDDDVPTRGGANPDNAARRIANKQTKATDGTDSDSTGLTKEQLDQQLNERLAPLEQKAETTAVNNEINQFLADNPDFKEFAGKVRTFAQHPSRKDTPISAIFYEVAGPNLMKMGAQRAKEADEKARQGRTGGSGGGQGQEGGKDYHTMSDKDLANEQTAVLNQAQT